MLLVAIPPNHLGLTLLASGISAGGLYLGNVAINAAMNNRMGALHKADAYSAVQFLVALATIPAGWLAGTLFAAGTAPGHGRDRRCVRPGGLVHTLMPAARGIHA